MAMREGCKYFESRTYNTGETVRKCDLDLAPEAPWRCPDDCPAYTPRLASVNWRYGSMVTPPTPAEPSSLGDPAVAALLDSAEDVLNNAGPRILADVERDRERAASGRGRDLSSGLRHRLGRLFRRGR